MQDSSDHGLMNIHELMKSAHCRRASAARRGSSNSWKNIAAATPDIEHAAFQRDHVLLFGAILKTRKTAGGNRAQQQERRREAAGSRNRRSTRRGYIDDAIHAQVRRPGAPGNEQTGSCWKPNTGGRIAKDPEFRAATSRRISRALNATQEARARRRCATSPFRITLCA